MYDKIGDKEFIGNLEKAAEERVENLNKWIYNEEISSFNKHKLLRKQNLYMQLYFTAKDLLEVLDEKI